MSTAQPTQREASAALSRNHLEAFLKRRQYGIERAAERVIEMAAGSKCAKCALVKKNRSV